MGSHPPCVEPPLCTVTLLFPQHHGCISAAGVTQTGIVFLYPEKVFLLPLHVVTLPLRL